MDNLVVAAVYSNDLDAHMAMGLLREAGIDCCIENEVFSRIYPIGFSALGGLRLMVRQSDLDAALPLLESLRP